MGAQVTIFIVRSLRSSRAAAQTTTAAQTTRDVTQTASFWTALDAEDSIWLAECSSLSNAVAGSFKPEGGADQFYIGSFKPEEPKTLLVVAEASDSIRDARAPLSQGPGRRDFASAAREKSLVIGLFGIYALVYLMPTLMPFIAHDYCKNSCETDDDKTQMQQLLLYMMVLQNICDVLGRLAPSYIDCSSTTSLAAWGTAFLSTFLAAVVACCSSPLSVSSTLSYDTAVFVIPALTGILFFSRGLLTTALYLRARSFPEKATVERVSMNMGLCGQMGALSSNVTAFALVQAFASRG